MDSRDLCLQCGEKITVYTNPDYRKCDKCGAFDYRYDCVVCGNPIKLDDCNVCEICEWEQDSVQEDDPDYRGGANKESLNEAKAAWAAKDKK